MAGYLSTGAFAARIGVSPRTVGNWCRAGRVRAIRTPGGHWRIHEDELQRTEMTVGEFAHAVGVHWGTVHRWIHAGKLHPSSGGGGYGIPYRIPASEAERIGPKSRA